MNKNERYISIDRISVSNNRIDYQLSYSKNVRKYFRTRNFFVEYDTKEEMNRIDESILVVPLISTLITVAWAADADIYVNSIDQTCLNSINKVKDSFKVYYPRFPYTSDIHAGKVIQNTFNNDGTALLFSGGLDSVVSCIRNHDLSPELISIWGADIPHYQENYWNKAREHNQMFASGEGLPIHFIRTNMKMGVNERLLEQVYAEHWWTNISHIIVILGLAAPLTANRIGSILMASAESSDRYIEVERVFTDEFRWADVGVEYDSSELKRLEKIRCVRNTSDKLAHLRVCYLNFIPYFEPKHYNCGHCEKCLRTIVGLLIEGIDPRNCGFDIDESFFDYVKYCLTKGILQLSNDDQPMWDTMQKQVPEQIQQDICGSRDFLLWFRKYDMSTYKVNNIMYYFWLLRYVPLSYKLSTINLTEFTRTLKERFTRQLKLGLSQGVRASKIVKERFLPLETPKILILGKTILRRQSKWVK